MAKHNREADEVMKGKNFGFLGKFRNRKFLEQGHNAAPFSGPLKNCDLEFTAGDPKHDACVAANRKAMETQPKDSTVGGEVGALLKTRGRFQKAFK